MTDTCYIYTLYFSVFLLPPRIIFKVKNKNEFFGVLVPFCMYNIRLLSKVSVSYQDTNVSLLGIADIASERQSMASHVTNVDRLMCAATSHT